MLIQKITMKKTILILAIILSACTKHIPFEEYLINKDDSFWVEKMMDSTGKYIYHDRQSVFHSDYTIENLASVNENKKGFRQVVLIEGGSPQKWSFNKNDNTLTTSYRTKFKIKKYLNDTIYMKITTAKHEDFILIRKQTK